MELLRVSVVQFPFTGQQLFKDFQFKYRKFVEQARDAGSKLVVFPELLTMDLLGGAAQGETEVAQIEEIARRETPKFFAWVKTLAQNNGLAILSGSSPRYIGNQIYNTSALFLPNGQVYYQEKVFLTPFERDWGWASGEEIRIIEAPWGRTVILICHDSEFPVISHQLARLQPELILVPSMTGEKSGFQRVRWCSQARAIEHACFVIHTGTVQDPKCQLSNWNNTGQAGVFSPSDESAGFAGRVAEGSWNQSDMITVTLPMGHLRQNRMQLGIYPCRDQNKRVQSVRVEQAAAPLAPPELTLN